MRRRWLASPDYRRAIETIIKVRKDRGLTQTEVAKRLGMHRSFLSKVELFERRLDIVEFIAVARAMGMSADALLDLVCAQLPDQVQI